MSSVIEWLFPTAYCISQNRLIKRRIDGGLDAQSSADAIESLDIEGVKSAYQDAVRSKDKLEDKAKTTVMGVTIAVSLVMGANGLVRSIGEKYSSVYVDSLLAVLVISAVFYMVAGGLHAIHALVAENVTHPIWVFDDDHLDEHKHLVRLNQDRNLIRNNSVFTAYECIRNALVCLSLILLISVNPFTVSDGQHAPVVHANYFYSEACASAFDSGVQSDHVEKLIEAEIARGTNATTPVTIVDDRQHLVVRFSEDGGNINVYYVDVYVP